MCVLIYEGDMSNTITENKGNEWTKTCIYLLLLVISLRMSSAQSDKQTESFIGRFHPFYRPRRPLGRVEV
jgi:hypothetical protein